MTDIIGEIAALLDRHGELEDCEGACECGYIGVGHREGWNWHVARVLAAELKLGHYEPIPGYFPGTTRGARWVPAT